LAKGDTDLFKISTQHTFLIRQLYSCSICNLEHFVLKTVA